jgi:hypothetical protein
MSSTIIEKMQTLLTVLNPSWSTARLTVLTFLESRLKNWLFASLSTRLVREESFKMAQVNSFIEVLSQEDKDNMSLEVPAKTGIPSLLNLEIIESSWLLP